MKKLKRRISLMLMALTCGLLLAQPVMAEEDLQVSIPVEISLSGTLPKEDESFTVNLEAEDASYPMPSGSENGLYQMSLKGAQTQSFPAISYDRVGVYTYTIYQSKGSNEKCSYDSTVYNLIVYITNASDGSGLKETAILTKDGSEDKLASASFKNAYQVEPTATPTTVPTSTPSKGTDTGDTTQFTAYIVAGAAAVCVLVIALVAYRKKNSEK